MVEIDLVYLWVDGNDPRWVEKRNACIGKPSGEEQNCEGRYAEHEELKYSLRSVEKYAPWIRKIFIVTDNQTPRWLDTSNPKVQIVDHTEIMPPECLPCFNSTVIHHCLHNIPSLSEHFLLADDDMYLNRPVQPGTFFAEDALPIVRLSRRIFRRSYYFLKTKVLRQPLHNYLQQIHNSALLVERRYGIYYTGKPHHNVDAYLKSTYQYTRELFDKEISATLRNHVRSSNDLQRSLYSYVALAEKRAHKVYVNQHTSFRLGIHKEKHYRRFKKYNPVFFCVNDSQYACDDDRKRAVAFLKEMFPNKSSFEK